MQSTPKNSYKKMNQPYSKSQFQEMNTKKININDMYDEKNVLKISDKIKIFISKKKQNLLPKSNTLNQMINLQNKLPNLHSIIGLPDLHHGYCFSIGSVVSTREIVVPEGIGNDINCGVRFIKCNVSYKNVNLKDILNEINENIPAGMGNERNNPIVQEIVEKFKKKDPKFNELELLNNILDQGLNFLIENEIIPDERNFVENKGSLPGNSKFLSQKAKSKGINQLGSLGSGNHFLEVQRVDKIFMKSDLKKLNFLEDELVFMIHTGSRGLGFNVCEEAMKEANIDTNDDIIEIYNEKYENIKFDNSELESIKSDNSEFESVKSELKNVKSKNIKSDNSELKDLIFFKSKTARQKYLLQMGSAANYAYCNRSIINLVINKILNKHGIYPELVYDVGHNSLNIENINNELFYVHRKGASRALPKFHPDLSEYYKNIGQPIPIGGSMGTASFLLISKMTAKTNFSCPHGSGRKLSRNQAKKKFSITDVNNSMKDILLICKTNNGAIEEHPDVYKNIDDVVDAAIEYEIVDKVVRLVPIGVIKG